MANEKLLKSYNRRILAVKITEENYEKLLLIEDGDGVLSEERKDNIVGDWLVRDESGYQLMAGNIKLFRR